MVAAYPLPRLGSLGTSDAMIAVAVSQNGVREGVNNDNPYGSWFGMNHVAWCAEFISWCAAHSGNLGNVPRYSYTPDGAQWFKDHGRWGTKPRKGAIGFVWSESMGRIHHTFLVTRVRLDGTFDTVEGNSNDTGAAQGDGVYRLHRKVSSLGSRGGFGYPKYKLPQISAAAAAAAAAAALAAAASHGGSTPTAKPPVVIVTPKPTPAPAPRVVALHPGVRPWHHDPQVKLLQGLLHLQKPYTTFYGSVTQAKVRAFHRAHPQFASGPSDPAIGPKGFRYLQLHAK